MKKKLKIFGIGICCLMVFMINIFFIINVNASDTDNDEGWGQHIKPCGDYITCRFDDINKYCTNGSGSVCYCYCD